MAELWTHSFNKNPLKMEDASMMVELSDRSDTGDDHGNKIRTQHSDDSSSSLPHPFRSCPFFFMHAIWAVSVVILLGILVVNSASTTALNNLNSPEDSKVTRASNIHVCAHNV